MPALFAGLVNLSNSLVGETKLAEILKIDEALLNIRYKSGKGFNIFFLLSLLLINHCLQLSNPKTTTPTSERQLVLLQPSLSLLYDLDDLGRKIAV